MSATLSNLSESPTYIQRILDLERCDGNEPDIFRGAAMHSDHFVRTFGGHVAGQALVAATRTVEGKKVHSLHGYFLRPGDANAETEYRVGRPRDGRSFATRTVEALQGGEVLFSMQASFHRAGDEGPEHSDEMRAVPAPDELPAEAKAPNLGPGSRHDLNEWDIRVVSPEMYSPNQYTTSQQVVWFRSTRRLPDEDTFHACTLTYMSDMTLLHSALAAHPGHQVQLASLDHAVWFLRPFRADEWLLYDQISPSAHAGRALTHGRIFDQQGRLVAVVVQEGLTRNLREGAHAVPERDPRPEPM